MESFKFELGEDKSYNYLIKMPMDSVSKENVEKLMKEHENIVLCGYPVQFLLILENFCINRKKDIGF